MGVVKVVLVPTTSPLLPLMTLGEQEKTVIQGLLFEEAFYKCGGPSIVMTNDSSTECNALDHVWLLCTFHFF